METPWEPQQVDHPWEPTRWTSLWDTPGATLVEILGTPPGDPHGRLSSPTYFGETTWRNPQVDTA